MIQATMTDREKGSEKDGECKETPKSAEKTQTDLGAGFQQI